MKKEMNKNMCDHKLRVAMNARNFKLTNKIAELNAYEGTKLPYNIEMTTETKIHSNAKRNRSNLTGNTGRDDHHPRVTSKKENRKISPVCYQNDFRSYGFDDHRVIIDHKSKMIIYKREISLG